MTKRETINNTVNLDDYVLVNKDKYDIVVDGILGKEGQMVGGIGRDAPKEKILAEYDKRAGLIVDKKGYKIKTGAFWDFKNKKSRVPPVIEYREGYVVKPQRIIEKITDDFDKPEKRGKGRPRTNKNFI